MNNRGRRYLDLGRLLFDLTKLTYAGLVLVAFGAWAFEKKIGTVQFVLITVLAALIGVFFTWWGNKS